MIPKFPNFKKIDLTDRKSIESYTHKYRPYSDFNFTSLWAWDTNNERSISELNGNLVVRFTDYETSEPFFSFLGSNNSKSTALELIDLAKKLGISPILRFVPEDTADSLSNSDLTIEEDTENFDYIFSVSQLIELRGLKFKTKKHTLSRFLSKYPGVSFELKELHEEEAQRHIISVLDSWERKKELDKKTYDFKHEKTAISRLLQTASNHKLIIGCVFLNDAMIGFDISEILPFGYAISHFCKTDNTYNGVSDFLNNEISKYLLTQGIKFWNWEQDLGINSLRKSKISYRPVSFLKKYKVFLP